MSTSNVGHGGAKLADFGVAHIFADDNENLEDLERLTRHFRLQKECGIKPEEEKKETLYFVTPEKVYFKYRFVSNFRYNR